ncbi:hypothetical protein RFI_15459 [Reticulomyxa filosa]|uniref:WD40 repeat-containing protein n=1 Tax=Reticulomyxa filosa TaxID=46433 RepID=X6N751_RETFI|nr:hypothetical protein RFI_15459 [Reticulomyxa filosa]|eukprot:ETO21743.1 hypothetical protein RFI_15459 [Reticulomyxa filosa]
MELVQKLKFDPHAPDTEESVFVTNIENNGDCIAISGDGVVRLYEESSFKYVTSFTTGQSMVYQLAFNNAHRNLLSICASKGNIFLLDTRCATNEKADIPMHLQVQGELFCCAYNDNIVCGGDDFGNIQIYDTRNVSKDQPTTITNNNDNNNNNNNNNNNKKNNLKNKKNRTKPQHTLENAHGTSRVTKVLFYSGANSTGHLFSSGEDGTICENDISVVPIWKCDKNHTISSAEKETRENKEDELAIMRDTKAKEFLDDDEPFEMKVDEREQEQEVKQNDMEAEIGIDMEMRGEEEGDGENFGLVEESFVNSFDCVNGVWNFGLFENHFMYALTNSNMLTIHDVNAETDERSLEFDSESLSGLTARELRLLSCTNDSSVLRISRVPFILNSKEQITVLGEIAAGRAGHVASIRCAAQFELPHTRVCRYLTGGEDNSLCIWRFDPEKPLQTLSSLTQDIKDFLQEDQTNDLGQWNIHSHNGNDSHDASDFKMPDKYTPARHAVNTSQQPSKFEPY